MATKKETPKSDIQALAEAIQDTKKEDTFVIKSAKNVERLVGVGRDKKTGEHVVILREPQPDGSVHESIARLQRESVEEKQARSSAMTDDIERV